jgi:hypothetical protein
MIVTEKIRSDNGVIWERFLKSFHNLLLQIVNAIKFSTQKTNAIYT